MIDFFELISSNKSQRINNKYKSILHLLWESEISRKEVAEKLNISKVAAGRSIEQLIEFGFVEEDKQALTGKRGRQPVPLLLNRDLFYSVGISLYNELFSEMVLLNARNETIGKIKLDYLPSGWEKKCDYMIDQAKALIDKHGISFSKIVGVGLALSGIVNPETGIVASSSQFPNDRNFNLLEYFSKHFGKKCYLINTAHLKAYIEYKWGHAKEMSSFLCFHSGFGLGMFLNGRLYRGHQYHAGELGLLQIQTTGEADIDGRVGTLGMIAPFYKISDRIEEIIAKEGKTEVKKYLPKGQTKVTIEMIVKAIEDGDQLCAQMMSEHFEVIGRTIINMAYVFNPEAIFLPSWTSRCKDSSIAIVRRIMGHYGVSNWELKTEILSAGCSSADLTGGAGLLPVEKLFNGVKL
jgi:N-acetylglucosamine repressor